MRLGAVLTLGPILIGSFIVRYFVKLVLHLRLVVSVILDLRLFAKLTPGFNTRGFSTHSEECPLVMGQNHKPVNTVLETVFGEYQAPCGLVPTSFVHYIP